MHNYSRRINMKHPFTWLPESAQKPAFWSLFVFTIIIIVVMLVLGDPLNTDAAPCGIVSFEFAGDLAIAQEMIESWEQSGQVLAGLSLGFDYVFIAAYALTLGLGCVLVARSLSERFKSLSSVGVVLAWAMFLAAFLDAQENYALIRVLLDSRNELWPVVAKWCAGPKFIIVALGLLYVVIGAIIGVVARGERRT
jgi:hypothetical protein